MAMALTKRQQEKVSKVTKLVDIVTSALSLFETSVSKALSNSESDKRESACFRHYTPNH